MISGYITHCNNCYPQEDEDVQMQVQQLLGTLN